MTLPQLLKLRDTLTECRKNAQSVQLALDIEYQLALVKSLITVKTRKT